MVYCSTFQLAWNELKNNIVKGDILLDGNEEGADFLNKSLSTKNDISEKSYLAMVGYNKDNIVRKINKSLKEKFGANAPIVNANLKDPEDILAYSYLNVDLQFMYKFQELTQPINFMKSKIKAFGIEKFKGGSIDNKLSNQINILDYKNDSDFIISLKTQNSKDEIILANVEPLNTLQNTIENINIRIKDGKKQWLNDNDTLQIPMIHLNQNKEFTEFENKRFLNNGFEDYKISKAIQDINFNLDNNGAEIKSDAKIEIKITARNPNMNHIKQKHLIFNKPFLIMLKEHGKSNPYFAAWVDNTDVLINH